MSDHTATYEGLFLFPQGAAGDLQAAADHLQGILTKHGAEIRSFAKWDEKRLAYEIQGNKRGIYFLVYFDCRPGSLGAIERDCNLSEELLRAMMLRADFVPQETIEAADGRQQLADEIKVRGEKSDKSETKGESRVTRGPREEPKADAPADAPAEGGEGEGEDEATKAETADSAG